MKGATSFMGSARPTQKMVYRGGCISTADEICSPFTYDAWIGVDLTS
ncbi:hypothetical protein C8J42_12023, partial [Sphingomonas sp. PP-CE-1A-559]